MVVGHYNVRCAREYLEEYREAIKAMLEGAPNARVRVENAREKLASPPLIEGLLARIEELERVVSHSCSCGSSPLPCVMHGPPFVSEPSPWCERCRAYHPRWAECGVPATGVKGSL